MAPTTQTEALRLQRARLDRLERPFAMVGPDVQPPVNGSKIAVSRRHWNEQS
jgi:hypothetical protein